MSWLYHGRNGKQCYYEPNCMVCYARLFFSLLRMWKKYRKAVSKKGVEP